MFYLKEKPAFHLISLNHVRERQVERMEAAGRVHDPSVVINTLPSLFKTILVL